MFPRIISINGIIAIAHTTIASGLPCVVPSDDFYTSNNKHARWFEIATVYEVRSRSTDYVVAM